MSSNQELHPGGRLGPYEIVAPLGAGGMGEVWRARDPRLERDVALKVLPAELSADPERLARFEREAKALAALNHPNIVTIHSVEEADDVRFLTMELVEGETLDRRISAGGMALEGFLDVAIPLADALTAAHARGVLHRDLKPTNVMVTPEGRVKVLDFGLAKLAEGPAEESTQVATGTFEDLTRAGGIVGTVPYMSPEQVEGKVADARSDLFSLGVVLFEMATGRRPFAGASSAALLSSILRDEPVSAAELRPELPRQLGRILRTCLAKDPERRVQTAKDVRNQLEELREEMRDEVSAARVVKGMEGAGRRQPPPSALKRFAAPGIVVVALLITGIFWFRPGDAPAPIDLPAAEPAYARTALAVLPFQNLSADPDHAYFAGGLHDELLTQLARVAAISLRGRTSVMGYAETTKPIRQIAEELEVGALIEGSVQVIGERLRVSVQLIDAATDEHLWAERYDRTFDDAFAIQSDVAQRVVEAVGAALSGAERDALAQVPTENAEAYRLYLQGREYHRRPGYRRQNWEIAQELYERALELDPEFVQAWAAVSEVHGLMHWFRYDTSPERVARQRETAEAALRLAPEAPEARMAMGVWHYWGRRDHAAALRELEMALRGMPNDARLVSFIGYVHRRLGNWDEVIAAFERAIELDPRDAQLFFELGGHSLRLMRRYAEAVRAYDRALSLAPDLDSAAVWRGWTYVLWQGQLDTLRSALARVPGDQFLNDRAQLYFWERDADRLLEFVAGSPDDAYVGLLSFRPRSLLAAWAHALRGDRAAARAAFDAALVVVDSAMQEIPDDWRLHAARGLALAGLGRRDAAVAEAAWLERSLVYHEDAYWGPSDLGRVRAQILAQAGEAEAALDEIEWILSRPAWFSVHMLRLDPLFDPLRDHPRYHALLARYAEP